MAVELAVGKRAGPPLAKLGIGFGIESPGALPEAEGVSGALADGLAALQQQGAEPHLGQEQGGKVTTGTSPHHHRTLKTPRGDGHRLVGGVGARPQMGIAGEALEQACLSSGIQGQLEIQAVNQRNRLGLAGVDAAFDQPQALQLVGLQP